jgi:4-amino-4-deoxy-L-arabinose transferase-like glycosyltransferase
MAVPLYTSLPSFDRSRTAWAAAAVTALCHLFFLQLGARDLASSHEARAAQNAQTMLDSGRWHLPRLFDGQVEMQKPPLYYWLVALCGLVNGGAVDAWCVRLPAALSAAGCVLLLFWFGVLRGRPLAGFLAATMLATSLHFTALARTGRIDMPLAFTVSLSVVGAVQGFAQSQQHGGRAGWRWFLLMYLAVAAGLLLKGPIAVVLPGVVLLGLAKRGQAPFLCATATERHPKKRCLSPFRTLGWGVPLVVLLTLPWFLHANAATGGQWFRVFFWHHNVDRGLGTDEQLRSYPLWFYGPQLLADLLPWSLLLPLAAWYLWRRGWRGDAEARFGAVWLLAMGLLLSLMRFKRADYLLPAYPGAALLLGCAAEHWYRTRPSRRLAAAFASVVLATTAGWLGYLFWAVPLIEETRTYRPFAALIRRHSTDKVVFFRAEAHTLALHVGPPMRSLLEWENLDVWVARPQPAYIVLPPEYLAEAPKRLDRGVLEVVARSDTLAPPLHRHLAERAPWLGKLLRRLGDPAFDSHERPLVLVRTRCVPRAPANSYTSR